MITQKRNPVNHVKMLQKYPPMHSTSGFWLMLNWDDWRYCHKINATLQVSGQPGVEAKHPHVRLQATSDCRTSNQIQIICLHLGAISSGKQQLVWCGGWLFSVLPSKCSYVSLNISIVYCHFVLNSINLAFFKSIYFTNKTLPGCCCTVGKS